MGFDWSILAGLALAWAVGWCANWWCVGRHGYYVYLDAPLKFKRELVQMYADDMEIPVILGKQDEH